jgi:hypothetical protein
VLAVVDDHRDVAVADHGRHPGRERGTGPDVDAQRRGDHVECRARVCGRELAEDDRLLGPGPSKPAADLDRQLRLADTARPDQADQPMEIHQRHQLGDHLVATDERGGGRRQPARGRPCRRGSVGDLRLRGVQGPTGQHRVVLGRQHWRGLDAQLVAEEPSKVVVHPQGLHVPAGRRQDLHQQLTGPLAERFGVRQRRQLGDQAIRVAACQPPPCPHLPGAHA